MKLDFLARRLCVVLAATTLAMFAGSHDAPAQNAAARGHPLLIGAMPPSPHADKLLKLCLEVSRYKGPPILFLSSQSSQVQNACATYIQPAALSAAVPNLPIDGAAVGIPVILYNPTFMTQLSFATDNDYTCLYVLAHELGHIVCGHVDPARPWERHRAAWDQELEADQFAGRVLARLGAKPSELTMAHRVMVSTNWIQVRQENGRPTIFFADRNMRIRDIMTGSKSHPDAVRRVRAVARGWTEGGGEGDVETDLGEILSQMVHHLAKWDPGL